MVKTVLKSLSLKNKQGKIKTKMICKKRPNPLCMFDSHYQEHTGILENNRESFWMILIEIRKGLGMSYQYIKVRTKVLAVPFMALNGLLFMYLAFSLDVVQGLVTKWNTILLNIKKKLSNSQPISVLVTNLYRMSINDF